MVTKTTTLNQLRTMCHELFPLMDDNDIDNKFRFVDFGSFKDAVTSITFDIESTPTLAEINKALEVAQIDPYWVHYAVRDGNNLTMTVSNFESATYNLY